MFCNVIGTETQGSAQVPCQSALNATSIETKTTQTFQELESYGQNYVYKNINPELIKTLIAIGFIQNSIQFQKVMVQFPIKPFEFSANLSSNYYNYGVKFKYEF